MKGHGSNYFVLPKMTLLLSVVLQSTFLNTGTVMGGKQSTQTEIIFVVFFSGVKSRWKTLLGETPLTGTKQLSAALSDKKKDTHIVCVRPQWESFIERSPAAQ